MRIQPAEERRIALPPRARIVPIASVMAGSLLTILPVIADAPLWPPFGLMMLLGWRLLRPELWQAWIAIPLGAFDDLFSGQPLGSGIMLWTLTLLVLDMMDNPAMWRDYWVEWLVGAIALAFCLAGGAAVVTLTTGGSVLMPVLPQIAISVAAFPFFLRLCALLDRWRLRL